MNSDRQLLFGLLALQNEFIDQRQLLSAVGNWIADRSQPFDSVLVQQRFIHESDRALLSALVDRFIAARGGDVAASLQALSSIGSVREELKRLEDDEVQASVAKLNSVEYLTVMPAVGQSTSVGQRFQIRRPLDRGGLGIVSVAVDNEFNREVALKEIRGDRADDQSYRSKFLLEAEITGRLEHPGIVPVYGLGTRADGRPYYAMRLIRGDNLWTHIKRFHDSVKTGEEPFDSGALRKLLRRFLDVCQAIQYAHTRGVLHRDLKPGNVMLGKFGETLVVDWGLAKPCGAQEHESQPTEVQPESSLIPSGISEGLTVQGSIVGTAAYAPPEQLQGNLRNVNERSDVYGLGAILYELFVGKPPAQGETLEAIIKAAIAGDIKPPRHWQPKLPKPLEAICLKAISRLPNDRYATAADLALEVERWLDDLPVLAYAEPFSLRTRRWIKGHQSLVATAAAIVLMSTLGLALFSSIVTHNNTQLAKLNFTLDTQNTELDRQKIELDERNTLLDRSNAALVDKNEELTQSNGRETEARKLAEKQSQVALSTLSSIVLDLQRGLKGIPGGSEVRRRLLSMSITQLENVATDFVAQSTVERTTITALHDLGDVVLQFRSDATSPDQSSTPSAEQQEAVKLARSLYQKAFDIAEKLLADSPDKARVQRDMMVSCEKLGDINLQTGKAVVAIEFYSKSLAFCEALSLADPQDRQAKREWSSGFEHLGDASLQSGQSPKAMDYYQRGLKIREQLANDDPKDTQSQRDLAVSFRDIGDVCLKSGELKRARGFYQQSLDISLKLAQSDPTSGPSQRALAISYSKLGDADLQLKQIAEALTCYRQGMEFRRKLAAADPGDLSAQRALALSFDRLGQVSLQAGQPQAALEYFTSSSSISESLVRSDPSDAQALRDLSVVYNGIGDAHLAQQQLPASIEYYQKSLELRQQLSAASPRNLRAQRDVSITLERLGDVCLDVGNLPDSLSYYEQGLAIRKTLSLHDPSDTQSVQDLSVAYRDLGDVNFKSGKGREAIEFYQQSLQMSRQLAESNSQSVQVKRAIAVTCNKLGDASLRVSETSEALAYFQGCLKCREELLAASPGNLRVKRDLSVAQNKLGDAFLLIGKPQDALQVFNQSLALRQEIAGSQSKDLQSQQDLAMSYRKVGSVELQLTLLPPALDAMRRSVELSQTLADAHPMDETIHQELAITQYLLATIEHELKNYPAASESYRRGIAALQTMIGKSMSVEKCRQGIAMMNEKLAANEALQSAAIKSP